MTCTYGYSHFRHFQTCCNRDGNTIFKYMNYVPIVVATDLEVHFSVLKKGVSQYFCLYSVCTSHWCLVMSFWRYDALTNKLQNRLIEIITWCARKSLLLQRHSAFAVTKLNKKSEDNRLGLHYWERPQKRHAVEENKPFKLTCLDFVKCLIFILCNDYDWFLLGAMPKSCCVAFKIKNNMAWQMICLDNVFFWRSRGFFFDFIGNLDRIPVLWLITESGSDSLKEPYNINSAMDIKIQNIVKTLLISTVTR